MDADQQSADPRAVPGYKVVLPTPSGCPLIDRGDRMRLIAGTSPVLAAFVWLLWLVAAVIVALLYLAPDLLGWPVREHLPWWIPVAILVITLLRVFHESLGRTVVTLNPLAVEIVRLPWHWPPTTRLESRQLRDVQIDLRQDAGGDDDHEPRTWYVVELTRLDSADRIDVYRSADQKRAAWLRYAIGIYLKRLRDGLVRMP